MSYIQSDYQFNELFSKRHYSKDTKARVLPFYVVNGSIYFLLCEENRKCEYIHGTYNILGGHRDVGETIIECAKRELQEETLNTIPFDYGVLNKDLIVRKNKRYIIFLPIFCNVKKIIPDFLQNKLLLEESSNNVKYIFEESSSININCLCEIKSLKWINDREIRSRKIYRSVQDIFKNIITEKNESMSFENYMYKLKNLYNSFGKSCFSDFYIPPRNYIFRKPKEIFRQEYFATTT